MIALEMFYLVLRDAGRDQPTSGNYDPGFAAIDALFPVRSGKATCLSPRVRSRPPLVGT